MLLIAGHGPMSWRCLQGGWSGSSSAAWKSQTCSSFR